MGRPGAPRRIFHLPRCQEEEGRVTCGADAPWGNWQPEGFWSPKFRFES